MVVKRDLFKTDNADIASEILKYLADHPNAADTLNGIVQWWLPERTIRFQVDQVRQALDELIAKGMVTKQRRSDSKIVYRANRSRLEDIKRLSS